MKKIVSLLMAAVMTAAAPAAVFAELSEAQKTVRIGSTADALIDDSFANGHKWNVGGALAIDAGVAENFISDGTYTWIKTIKGAWGASAFNDLDIYKDFTTVADGESLELSVVVKPIKTELPGQSENVYIDFLSSDGNKTFNIFTYNEKTDEGCVAKIANSAASTETNWDIPMHGKDVKINVSIKPAGDDYAATVTAADADDGTVYLNSGAVSLAWEDVTAFSRLRIKATTSWYVETRSGVDNVLGIKSVKLENVKDGVLYEDTGNRLREKVYDQDPGKIFVRDTDKNTIPDYAAGNRWFANEYAADWRAFKSDGSYMWMGQHDNQFVNGSGSLTKRFDGITDGATLNMQFDFKAKELTSDSQGLNMAVSLTDAAETHKLNLLSFMIRTTANGNGPFRYGVGGLDQKLNGAYNSLDGYSAKKDNQWHVNEWHVIDAAKDYRLELTLSPKDADNYNARIVIRNVSDDEVVEDLTNRTNPLVISREIAESLNTVELYAYSSWGEGVEANRIVPFGVRNVEISVSNGEKTELVNGENKIYVPYEILSKTPLSAAVCAAVVNKDGIQTDFDVVNLDSVIKYRDNVELTVNITDAKNDYVKVFAFDSTGTLVPLMNVKTIK